MALFVQPKQPIIAFFAFSLDFTCPKALHMKHTYLISTSCFFLSRKYSLTLFRAHFQTFKMLQGSICPAKTPFDCLYSLFHRDSRAQRLCMRGTFSLLAPFALFSSREYSLSILRAHFEMFKMLQGSISPANTPFYCLFWLFHRVSRAQMLCMVRTPTPILLEPFAPFLSK